MSKIKNARPFKLASITYSQNKKFRTVKIIFIYLGAMGECFFLVKITVWKQRLA